MNKECNLKRHYQTKQAAKYDACTGQLRKDKIATLKRTITKQQDVFTKRNAESASNVEASFAVSALISKRLKPFTGGEFVK